MSFTVGFLCGIAFSILAFVMDIFLNQRNHNLSQAKRYIEGKLKPQGFIIKPKQKSVEDQALEILNKE